MGILDEAIREHIDLKRRHGAAEGELRKLEDEAFGPPARPDEPSAAPTGVQAEPAEAAVAEAPPSEAAEPPPPAPAEEEPAMEHPTVVAPEPEPEPEPEPAEPPAAQEESAPAAEAPPEAEQVEPPPSPPAEQPTELYDVGEGLGSPESPSAEELVEEEAGEPRLAPVEPVDAELAPPEEDEKVADDQFFSEQSLSDELDRALDAPETEEAPAPPEPPVEEAAAPPEPPVEEAPPAQPEPEAPAEGFEEEQEDERGEDVLEETPEFLQDTPEHDRLWFEQKPPKDFDFDD